jgi:hypothetical protein
MELEKTEEEEVLSDLLQDTSHQNLGGTEENTKTQESFAGLVPLTCPTHNYE